MSNKPAAGATVTKAGASKVGVSKVGVSKAGFLLLVCLWLVWGTSWPAMRIVFTELPIWQFRAVTCAISGFALLLMGLAAKQRWRVPRRHWGAIAGASLFNMTLWHVLVGYGLFYIGAGHAVIIVYTLPVWTAILSVLFLKESMNWRTILALIFGMAGVLVLLSSDFEQIGTNPIGAAFILGAAISWAIGTIIVKRVQWTTDLYALAGWQLLIGLVPIAVIAFATERFTMHEASPQAIWAGLYVLFFGLIAGYALWFKIIEILPVTIASIGALMIPVIGVASGALILGEPVTWIEGMALLLVLGAVGMVLFGHPRRKGSSAAE